LTPIATSETDDRERWKRISNHVQKAFAVVQRDGKAILIKFDGERDNGKIYTVVIDFGLVTSSRNDSGDLEDMLSRLFGDDISGATLAADDFAEQLRLFDLLARRGFVVILVIQREGSALEFEVSLSRIDTGFKPMRRNGPAFSDIAAAIIRHSAQIPGV
jgi:hypothetical protein